MSTVHFISGKQYTIFANENRPQSIPSLVSEYLQTAEGGPFRFIQFCDKACGLLATLNFANSEYLKDASKTLRAGWSITILPSLPGFFGRAFSSLSALVGKTSAIPVAGIRKTLTAIQDSASLCSALAFSVLPFIPKEIATEKLLQGAGITAIIADSCDLVKNGQDAWEAQEVVTKSEETVSPEFKEAITATRNFHMIKAMKSVCSISSFVFGISAISACFSKVPGQKIIAAATSLMGTIFSIGASLYESNMKFERVKFFSEKHVQYIGFNLTA